MRIYTLTPLPIEIFKGYSALARIAFGIIWERYRLSMHNYDSNQGAASDQWYDQNEQRVYCTFNQLELANLVGCSERSIRNVLNELRRDAYIETKKAKYGGSLRVFVHPSVARYMLSAGRR